MLIIMRSSATRFESKFVSFFLQWRCPGIHVHMVPKGVLFEPAVLSFCTFCAMQKNCKTVISLPTVSWVYLIRCHKELKLGNVLSNLCLRRDIQLIATIERPWPWLIVHFLSMKIHPTHGRLGIAIDIYYMTRTMTIRGDTDASRNPPIA